jgi:phosphate:Na+ symporter
MTTAMVLQVLAGIGVLIYGIILMGDSLQIIAGDRMRTLISKLAGTPLKGLLVGTVVTGILQSSGATTVMVVSFVDVGFMTLNQAIGVELGANIGTTVTAQLIAFNITNIAYFLAFLGAAICILSKNKKNKQIGACIVGFALLFIGIEMMKKPLSFLSSRPDIISAFSSHLFYAFIFGFIITLIVQSSSATVGLTMAVAAQGVISLETAIAICLGENIGSTTTAVIASLSGNRSAKQAAAAHFLIKVLGTVVIMAILPFYTSFITHTSTDISRQVANAHTIFNVIIACLFLPFVPQYAKFIRKILPDDQSVAPVGAVYLNRALINVSSAAAVDAVRKEMIRLGSYALRMIQDCESIFMTFDDKLVDVIYKAERNVNDITHEIIKYATEVGQTGLSSDLSTILNSCTGGVGDIERIGDHATNLIEVYQFLKEHKLTFSPKAQEECKEMFDLAISTVSCSISALEDENSKLAQEAVDLEDRVDYMERTLRAQHIARLNAGGCNPSSGVAFIDILSNLERVGDHAHNLAMVVFDIERIHHNGR